LELPVSGLRIERVRPPRVEPVPPVASIEQAFDEPIGDASVAEAFRGARSVLVAVSDATRQTGAPEVLPALVERIERDSGARLTFIVGGGIHRQPTDEEIALILGPRLHGRYPVLRHDPLDDGRLRALGSTRAGTPVRVNAAIGEHDRLVLTGAVSFHYYAGFGGGRKAVVPGLAARETVVCNHLRALRSDGSRHPLACAGRLHRNPVHRDMVEGAAMTRPCLLVNSVMGAHGRIERLFVGHWRRAHEAACRYLRRTRTIELRPRDVVIASAGGAPYDVDLIQSHKAFESVFAALRPAGTLVLVARCPDGAGHPDFLEAFERRSEREMAALLRRDFRVYFQTALAWRHKAERCRLILVSGLDPALVRRLGAEPAADLGQALRLVESYHRSRTPAWLFDRGSRHLVVPIAGRDAD